VREGVEMYLHGVDLPFPSLGAVESAARAYLARAKGNAHFSDRIMLDNARSSRSNGSRGSLGNHVLRSVRIPLRWPIAELESL
jgi:hypothetical protein